MYNNRRAMDLRYTNFSTPFDDRDGLKKNIFPDYDDPFVKRPYEDRSRLSAMPDRDLFSRRNENLNAAYVARQINSKYTSGRSTMEPFQNRSSNKFNLRSSMSFDEPGYPTNFNEPRPLLEFNEPQPLMDFNEPQPLMNFNEVRREPYNRELQALPYNNVYESAPSVSRKRQYPSKFQDMAPSHFDPPPPPPAAPLERKERWEKKPKGINQEVKCKVCEISLSSQIVYEDHIAGKKHIKKAKDAKQYSCELCHTQMFTAEEQKVHFDSETHIESVKVSEYFEKQKQEDPENMKTTKKISSYLSKKELEEIKNQTDKDIAWVSCDLCNIKCNSQAMLDLHNNSRKHKLREQDHTLNTKSSSLTYSCSHCNYLCYTMEEQETHLKSEAHCETLRKKIANGTIQFPIVPNEVMATTISNEIPDVQTLKDANNVIWYPCKICDVKMNSLDNYKTHTNSKKHAAKVQGQPFANKKMKYTSEALRNSYTKFVLSGELGKKVTGDPNAFCTKCEIQFKSSMELEQHFLTPAHKNYNPYKKKFFFDQEQQKNAKRAKLKNKQVIQKSQNQIPEVSPSYGYGYEASYQKAYTTPYTPSYVTTTSYLTNSSYATPSYSSSFSTTPIYTTRSTYTTPSYDTSNYETQTSNSSHGYSTGYTYKQPYYQH